MELMPSIRSSRAFLLRSGPVGSLAGTPSRLFRMHSASWRLFSPSRMADGKGVSSSQAGSSG
eukprot:5033650-Pyramimonas_sp.AAC.1